MYIIIIINLVPHVFSDIYFAGIIVELGLNPWRKKTKSLKPDNEPNKGRPTHVGQNILKLTGIKSRHPKRPPCQNWASTVPVVGRPAHGSANPLLTLLANRLWPVTSAFNVEGVFHGFVSATVGENVSKFHEPIHLLNL